MRTIRFLLADDNRMVRQFLAYLLDGLEDIKVVGEAQDGYEAIEKTRRLLPDAVVMDISMPRMNGIEATQNIHSEFPDIRVIGLSISDDPETTKEMLDAGAVTCFSKSLSWHSTISRIRQALALNSSPPGTAVSFKSAPSLVATTG